MIMCISVQTGIIIFVCYAHISADVPYGLLSIGIFQIRNCHYFMPFHSDQQPQLGCRTHKFSAVLSSDLVLPLMSPFFRSDLHHHLCQYFPTRLSNLILVLRVRNVWPSYPPVFFYHLCQNF